MGDRSYGKNTTQSPVWRRYVMSCNHGDWDVSKIITFWGCYPVPEQHVLVTLSDFVPLPNPIVPIQNVIDILTLYGVGNAEKRADIMIQSPYIYTIAELPMVCEHEKGCINTALSPWIADVYEGRLLGEFQIGAPVCPPCYYPIGLP
jgi:hypothetical protein